MWRATSEADAATRTPLPDTLLGEIRASCRCDVSTISTCVGDPHETTDVVHLSRDRHLETLAVQFSDGYVADGTVKGAETRVRLGWVDMTSGSPAGRPMDRLASDSAAEGKWPRAVATRRGITWREFVRAYRHSMLAVDFLGGDRWAATGQFRWMFRGDGIKIIRTRGAARRAPLWRALNEFVDHWDHAATAFDGVRVDCYRVGYVYDMSQTLSGNLCGGRMGRTRGPSWRIAARSAAHPSLRQVLLSRSRLRVRR